MRGRILRMFLGGGFLFLLLLSIRVVWASSGDRQISFQHCVQHCKQKCTEAKPLAFHLRLLLWTCESDCDYQCQRNITLRAQAIGKPVHQYHGKWPFIRIMGVQEPASVVFSILNGLMHLKSWKMVKNNLSTHPMRKWLCVFVVLGTWTWFCSAVFHIRDFPLTEKLDYFSAAINVLYMFFLGIVRVFRLDNWRQTQIVAIACAIPYILHVSYLSLVKFDYGYNMMANAVVGLLSNVVWLVVSIQAFRNSQPFWWKPIVLIVLTDLAFGLEAFDFAPFMDTFDAHSLWHAATIPIVSQWYNYLVEDAKWDAHLEKPHKN